VGKGKDTVCLKGGVPTLYLLFNAVIQGHKHGLLREGERERCSKTHLGQWSLKIQSGLHPMFWTTLHSCCIVTQLKNGVHL